VFFYHLLSFKFGQYETTRGTRRVRDPSTSWFDRTWPEVLIWIGESFKCWITGNPDCSQYGAPPSNPIDLIPIPYYEVSIVKTYEIYDLTKYRMDRYEDLECIKVSDFHCVWQGEMQTRHYVIEIITGLEVLTDIKRKIELR